MHLGKTGSKTYHRCDHRKVTFFQMYAVLYQEKTFFNNTFHQNLKYCRNLQLKMSLIKQQGCIDPFHSTS